jgi:exodeoxyribonuclease-3
MLKDTPLRIVSWNVNGLRAILRKNFYEMIGKLQPDMLCLQEIKVDEGAIPENELPGSIKICNSAVRKGYSGAAIFSKMQSKNINCETHLDSLTEKHKGKVIFVKYKAFYLVNVYVPNSGSELGD